MPDADHLLNGPQRLHLSVLAAGIEDAIAEIERVLDPRLNAHATLTAYSDDLPAGLEARLRPKLAALRGQVARLTEQFALEPRSFSRASSIRAYVSVEVARIDESTVKQLRGYGSVAPELDAVLAPALADLRRTFTEISASLRDEAAADRVTG
jgi:hypothetical protein